MTRRNASTTPLTLACEAVRNDPGTVGGNPLLRAPPYGWEVRQTILGPSTSSCLAGRRPVAAVGRVAVAAALIPGRGGGGFGSLLTLWALANATVGTASMPCHPHPLTTPSAALLGTTSTLLARGLGWSAA